MALCVFVILFSPFTKTKEVSSFLSYCYISHSRTKHAPVILSGNVNQYQSLKKWQRNTWRAFCCCYAVCLQYDNVLLLSLDITSPLPNSTRKLNPGLMEVTLNRCSAFSSRVCGATTGHFELHVQYNYLDIFPLGYQYCIGSNVSSLCAGRSATSYRPGKPNPLHDVRPEYSTMLPSD